MMEVLANELKNAHFTELKNGMLTEWKNIYPNRPYSVSTEQDGTRIVCGISKQKDGFGLRQIIKYEKPNTEMLHFSGWSKAENVTGNYALTLDILHSDGTWTYLSKSWKKGTHDWEQIKASFKPRKPIREIRYYILLRRGSGKAYFRDVSLDRGKILPPASVTVNPKQETVNHLFNPALKIAADGKTLPGWENYNTRNPFSVEGDESNTLRICGRSDEKNAFGLRQIVAYSVPSLKPVNFSGWSKASNVARGTEYRIYLDILHADGTWTYSVKSDWKTGTHDWEASEFSYRPKKTIARIYYYILLRKNKGLAMFRDMTLTRGEPKLQFHYTSIYSLAPLKNDHYRIRYAFLKNLVKSEYQIIDSSGKILKTGSGNTRKIDFTVACPGKPAKLLIRASDGISSRLADIPIRHINVPERLANGKKIQVWTTDSMTKVSPLSFPADNAENTIRLALAGGERESAQLLISNVSNNRLKGISLEFSGLKNRSGKSFPGHLYYERVGYVPRAVDCNSHKEALPDAVYWLPDPLLPSREISVPAGGTQGIWITAAADRNATSGVWKGIIRVKGLPQNVEIPCEITIFGFSLPQRFSYRSAFAVMDGYLAMQYPEFSLRDIRRKAWDVMLEHRLNPDDITRTEFPEINDLLYARKRGMNYFTICNLVPKPKKKVLWTLAAPVSAYNEKLMKEFQQRFDPYVALLKKHGLDKDAAFYGFDERGKEYFPTIAKVHKMLKTRYGIPLFSTSSMYRHLVNEPERTDLYAQDWYCPPTTYYKKELSEKLRAKGHQVWWYTCCGPYYPYANFSNIEYPFRDARLIAWMTYFNQADGFLFWHTNNWLRGTACLDETSAFQPEFKLFVIGGSAGDGQFLYPGKDGPLPSIRLANLRDGSEDYDYLMLLEKKAGKDAALKAAEILVPDLCHYETDHKKILQVRKQIASAICSVFFQEKQQKKQR
jgi:hypothetical protein